MPSDVSDVSLAAYSGGTVWASHPLALAAGVGVSCTPIVRAALAAHVGAGFPSSYARGRQPDVQYTRLPQPWLLRNINVVIGQRTREGTHP